MFFNPKAENERLREGDWRVASLEGSCETLLLTSDCLQFAGLFSGQSTETMNWNKIMG